MIPLSASSSINLPDPSSINADTRQMAVFDGGGVRGTISCRILMAVLAQMGNLNTPDVFDLTVGTSTGTIIATGLTLPNPADPSKPLFTATQVHDLMFNNAPAAFHKSCFRDIETGDGLWAPIFTNVGLKTIINQFGTAKIGDLMTDVWFPTMDTNTYKPLYFSRKKALADTTWNLNLTDILLSTTAAPTYFSANQLQIGNVTHSLIDGGTFVNNPSWRAFTEAQRLYKCGFNQLILSIGTGKMLFNNPPASYQNQGLDKVLTWLITGMIYAEEECSIEGCQDLLGNRYIHLEPIIDNDSLDDASPKNMAYLENVADEWVEKNQGTIRTIAKLFKEKAPGESRHLVKEAYN